MFDGEAQVSVIRLEFLYIISWMLGLQVIISVLAEAASGTTAVEGEVSAQCARLEPTGDGQMTIDGQAGIDECKYWPRGGGWSGTLS